jgi:hypothetical protein
MYVDVQAHTHMVRITHFQYIYVLVHECVRNVRVRIYTYMYARVLKDNVTMFIQVLSVLIQRLPICSEYTCIALVQREAWLEYCMIIRIL